MDISAAARDLAQANATAEPNIIRIYWFPHEEQIRLVEVDETTMATGDQELHPYYFSAVADMPFVSAIALVTPEQAGRLPLPADWGTWESAQVLFDKQRKNA